MTFRDKKALLAITLLSLLAIFFIFDIHQYLSLAYIKENQLQLLSYRDNEPFLFTFCFIAIYISLTALAIPSAGILALVSGALFGVFYGALVAATSCTLGALLNFLWSRYLFNEWVQERLSGHLDTFNKGIEEEGGFYLFSIRLIPVFPFFIINLISGLTKIHTRDFILSTFFSMLFLTAAFAYAGKQLAAINSAADILSLPMLSAFAAIGIMPLLAKKILGMYRNRVQVKNNS